MDISYLKEFVVLSETQSFSETADQFFMTQSTISKHIKRIEDELGIDLFIRNSRSVRLTVDGEMFLKTARQLVQTMESYLTELENTRSKTLFVASVPMTPTLQITRLLVAFMKKHPELKISINKGRRSENMDRLVRRQSSVSFSYNDEELPKGVARIPFYEDELCVVVPKGHPLAKRESVRIEELSEEDLILPETDSAFYYMCTQLCRKAGFEPRVKIQLHKTLSMAEVVDAGLCVAILPRSCAEGFSPECRCKILTLTPREPLVTYVLYPEGVANNSSVTGKFVAFIAKYQSEQQK